MTTHYLLLCYVHSALADILHMLETDTNLSGNPMFSPFWNFNICFNRSQRLYLQLVYLNDVYRGEFHCFCVSACRWYMSKDNFAGFHHIGLCQFLFCMLPTSCIIWGHVSVGGKYTDHKNQSSEDTLEQYN
jgi:hypothetical protein